MLATFSAFQQAIPWNLTLLSARLMECRLLRQNGVMSLVVVVGGLTIVPTLDSLVVTRALTRGVVLFGINFLSK